MIDNEWYEYASSRLTKHVYPNIRLIKPLDDEDIRSLECSICGFLMGGLEDMLSYEEYGCCQECMFKWAEANRERWHLGWRPTSEDIAKHITILKKRPTYRIE